MIYFVLEIFAYIYSSTGSLQKLFMPSIVAFQLLSMTLLLLCAIAKEMPDDREKQLRLGCLCPLTHRLETF